MVQLKSHFWTSVLTCSDCAGIHFCSSLNVLRGGTQIEQCSATKIKSSNNRNNTNQMNKRHSVNSLSGIHTNSRKALAFSLVWTSLSSHNLFTLHNTVCVTFERLSAKLWTSFRGDRLKTCAIIPIFKQHRVSFLSMMSSNSLQPPRLQTPLLSYKFFHP